MHVDHIVSIRQAFKLGWPVEKCADISNLQMLDRDVNMKKSNTSYCKWQPKNNDLVCQKLF